MLGFFSFTEVTDPSRHGAYNEWHLLDHMPEQFSLDGVRFGRRWVCTPECQLARVAVSPLLARCHYMTLYLMRDAGVLPDFFALARRLRDEDRFFADRRAHLSGPFEVTGRWASTRVKVSEQVVPFRPAAGVYVVVGPSGLVGPSGPLGPAGALDGAAMVTREGVAGAWSFASDGPPAREVTVAFVDGDLASVAGDMGQWCLENGHATEWAGPLERIDADPDSWDWFDRLTPK